MSCSSSSATHEVGMVLTRPIHAAVVVVVVVVVAVVVAVVVVVISSN